MVRRRPRATGARRLPLGRQRGELAVGVATELGVQHSFWAVLGTLSVLRSNALSTGQNVLRGLAGSPARTMTAGPFRAKSLP